MSLRRLSFTIAFLCGTTFSTAAQTNLVMVEEHGCVWCARWNEEIADIYPKTSEGKAAPLIRIDIHARRPNDMTFERSLHFTPTFVLFVDGTEASRIEGSPGEDFLGLAEKSQYWNA